LPNDVKILETTLRDGSYTIDFSFSSDTTGLICKKLEESGFELIEIGHGAGLNASNSGHGISKQTDEEYMISAKQNLKHSKYGMFCIPGIARLSDIDLAAKHDMGFIRIGTDVTNVEESKDFIKLAKDYGMFVAANYMKSYAISEEKFSDRVKQSENFGADIVYIVDSSGGMFPEDVNRYYNAIRKVSDISVGFHAHDNLGMAIANSLTAIEIGVDIVDSSLQGLGRSSGNACTEVLVLALKKRGYKTNIDFKKIFDLGHDHIQKLIPIHGRLPLDVISGYSDFHSSYMPKILEYSSKYEINPISLIIEISKIDKLSVKDETLDEIAKNMIKDKESCIRYGSYHYVGGEQNKK
jgi:4-hydroxy 2-oxovalerate aldolase